MFHRIFSIRRTLGKDMGKDKSFDRDTEDFSLRCEILRRPTRWHTRRRVAGIGYVSRWHALYSSSTATGASTSDEPLSEVYDEAVESEDGSDASDACADDLETI